MTFTKRIPSLQHEAFDDSVEDDTIVVAIPRVGDPVLHSLGALVREQLDMDVTTSAVDDGCLGQGPCPALCGICPPCCQHLICTWLLIEYITVVVHGSVWQTSC